MAGVSTLFVPFFPSIEAHIYTMFNSEQRFGKWGLAPIKTLP